MGPPFSKLEVKVCEKGSQRPTVYQNDFEKKIKFSQKLAVFVLFVGSMGHKSGESAGH
jgi:hypothetical protein